jgi:putative endonuclease
MIYKVIYLYIVECSDKTYYTGVSSDLDNRLIKHNIGYYESCYTFTRRPVELKYHNLFTDFLLAFSWEDRIKRWSHAKKKALIDGDYDALIELSKKKFKKK